MDIWSLLNVFRSDIELVADVQKEAIEPFGAVGVDEGRIDHSALVWEDIGRAERDSIAGAVDPVHLEDSAVVELKVRTQERLESAVAVECQAGVDAPAQQFAVSPVMRAESFALLLVVVERLGEG